MDLELFCVGVLGDIRKQGAAELAVTRIAIHVLSAVTWSTLWSGRRLLLASDIVPELTEFRLLDVLRVLLCVFLTYLIGYSCGLPISVVIYKFA